MKHYGFLLLLLAPTLAFSETRSFEEVWQRVSQKSYQHQALQSLQEANEASLIRAQRHWLPRLHGGAQWAGTNDPGQVFFSHLGQRSIEATDFVPSTLNDPGLESFIQGMIALDFPLYEGGSRAQQVSMIKIMVQSSELDVHAQKSQEYAELSRQYGKALVTHDSILALDQLRAKLKQIIGNYQTGAKQNPVGYSGLLGLRGVLNRIEGYHLQYESEKNSAMEWMNARMKDTQPWEPLLEKDFQGFVAKTLGPASASDSSSQLQSYRLQAQSLEHVSKMEKARFMPRAGLFAQNNFYQGPRDFEQSQVFGLYLNWDFYNPDSTGRVAEAKLKASAMAAKVSAQAQDEKSNVFAMTSSGVALEKTISLLDASDLLLEEQTREAMKLFKNGILTALQLSEVLNRRVDLVEQRKMARQQLLDVHARLYQMKN